MQGRKLIDDKFIPEASSRVDVIDGKQYLVANDVMYTFYRRTKGEFSPFFLALRDKKTLLGCRCGKCNLIRVPPFLTHCPDCNFCPTELIEIGQIGTMLHTPPITYFATSLFQHMAPYGRGRVVLQGADTALSINVYTTKGILRPNTVKKGTEVKVVFKDDRIGEMTDVFCVPTTELTKKQNSTVGLQESGIDWESPAEPLLPPISESESPHYKKAKEEIRDLLAQMNRSEPARKAIVGWKRTIRVKTQQGEFAIRIDDGNITLADKLPAAIDFAMVCSDIRALADGLAYRGALTDSVINGSIWISKNLEFNTIFKLDRMARFLARSKKSH